VNSEEQRVSVCVAGSASTEGKKWQAQRYHNQKQVIKDVVLYVENKRSER